MEPERLVSNVCHHFGLGHVLDWRMLEGGEDNLSIRVMTESGRTFVVRAFAARNLRRSLTFFSSLTWRTPPSSF
jgi:hypothetical protein